MSFENLISVLRQPPELLVRLQAVPGLHLVGGYLREAWRGLVGHDIDLIAEGDLSEALAAIEAVTGARAIELNQRFASYRVAYNGWLVDVSPAHPEGLAADLYRRDYTVNTLSAPLASLGPELASADILGHPMAFEDLESRTLRMVARENLELDPARILRGYRLAACNGLAPEPETRECWRDLATSVVNAAPERLHEELLRWFSAGTDIAESVGWCADDEVLWALFPPLRDSVDCGQNAYHHLDVWPHTLEAVHELQRLLQEPPPLLAQWREQFAAAWAAPVTALASAGALTRLALLLHDCGKPMTRQVQEDGRISFYGHQEAGARLAAPLLDWLRFATDESRYIELLIIEHLRLGFYSDHEPVPRRLIYRFIANLGDATPLMILHSLADCAAHRGELSAGSFERHELAAAEILSHYFAADVVAAPPVLLDGHAIMQLLGLAPGKEVGRLKAALLEATAAGEISTVVEAEAMVRDLHAVGETTSAE